MPETLLYDSMLFPVLHALSLWWTFGAFGAFEWNGLTFAMWLPLSHARIAS